MNKKVKIIVLGLSVMLIILIVISVHYNANEPLKEDKVTVSSIEKKWHVRLPAEMHREYTSTSTDSYPKVRYIVYATDQNTVHGYKKGNIARRIISLYKKVNGGTAPDVAPETSKNGSYLIVNKRKSQLAVQIIKKYVYIVEYTRM